MSNQARFLPYGRQSIDQGDVDAVIQALGSDYLTTGPLVDAFDQALAASAGAAAAVCCNSGTAALHLATLGLGYGPNDAVIVPSLTFLATANAVRYVGAHVIFADVDRETGLLGPDQVRQAVARCPAGAMVRAIAPVHLNGQTADLASLSEVARELDAVVIEDACHAFGATYRRADGSWVPVGSCRDSIATALSFHPVKAFTTAEGGATLTNDEALGRRMARYRSHGMTRRPEDFQSRELAFDTDGTPNPWYYEMAEPGFNYRLPDVLCALGIAQLRKLPGFIERRRAVAAAYDQRLGRLAPVVRRVPTVEWSTHAYHLFAVHIDFQAIGMSRARVMAELRKSSVGTQVHYLPVHLQPYYRGLFPDLNLPGAEGYYASCLSLPIYPAMDEQDVERVVSALERLVSG